MSSSTMVVKSTLSQHPKCIMLPEVTFTYFFTSEGWNGLNQKHLEQPPDSSFKECSCSPWSTWSHVHHSRVIWHRGLFVLCGRGRSGQMWGVLQSSLQHCLWQWSVLSMYQDNGRKKPTGSSWCLHRHWTLPFSEVGADEVLQSWLVCFAKLIKMYDISLLWINTAVIFTLHQKSKNVSSLFNSYTPNKVQTAL